MKTLRRNFSVSKIALCSGLIGLCFTAGANAQTPPVETPEDVSKQNPDGIEVIIITATRRETVLQNTPQAVSVITGEDQALTGRDGLEDLSVSVPNVNFSATSNTSQLYVRGIGNTFISAGGDPGVALYQDSAYLSDQTTTNANFFDVERVEVLRGPQGGLYGRNATGGAINVISAAPTSEASGQVSVVAGDYGRLESDGFISGPLGVADTYVRLSYQLKHLDGFITNTYEPPANDRDRNSVPDRLDDLDSQAVRLQTLTDLSGGGTLKFILSQYREADNGPALAVVPTPGFVYPAEALYGAVPSSDPRNITVDQGDNAVEVSTFNANWDQPIGDGVLTVTGNYRRSEQEFLNDCDGTPITNCTYIRDTRSTDYFGDVHFASSPHSDFQFILGAT